MATIYEIADKYKLIQQLIEEGAPEEAFVEALNAIDGELSEKLENYAALIKNFETDVAGLKVEEDRLKSRRISRENAIKRMKENMYLAMKTAKQDNVKSAKFTFYIQSNKPSLVLDENLIPQEFIRTEEKIVIDKTAIEEKLKNGEVVQGATFKQGESIRIR